MADEHEKRTEEMLEEVPEKYAPAVNTEWVDDPRVPRILRKVDLRLCLTLAALYVVNQIDRVNLGVAIVAGMGADLGFVGAQYNTIVLVFFGTYALANPVATVFCRKFGPRLFISGLTLSWGAIIVGMGFAKGWKVLVACRVLLGIIEGGFFPSALFLMSMWYVRSEVAKRNAAMYLAGVVAAGFGGILAYGVSSYNRVERGWRS